MEVGLREPCTQNPSLIRITMSIYIFIGINDFGKFVTWLTRTDYRTLNITIYTIIIVQIKGKGRDDRPRCKFLTFRGNSNPSDDISTGT